MRLCAQALRDRVPNPVQWIRTQAYWDGSPPSARTVQKWFQQLQGANIDLVSLQGPGPPMRMTLSQRRDAQHTRLAEHLVRLVTALRAAEQRYDEAVEGYDEKNAGASEAELASWYHGELATLNRSYIDTEREYRMGLAGVTVEDFSDRDIRAEIVGSLIEAAAEFDAGEAERIIAALRAAVQDGADDADDSIL